MRRLAALATAAALCLSWQIEPARAAFVFSDIACETTTTAGTGTVNLAGALTGGYLGFLAAGIATGSTVPYHLKNGSQLETGIGTFTDAAPDTLSRTAYYSTDGSGAELTLSGTTTVCIGPTTQVFTGAVTDLSVGTVTAATNITSTAGDLVSGDDVLITDDIDFGAGDVQIAYSANDLAFTGVTGDYSFDDTVGVTGSVTASVDVTATAGDVTAGDDLTGDDLTLQDDLVIAGMTSTDAGAVGTQIRIHHDSASPADGDLPLDILVFAGADDEEVGRIALEVDDGATTTEDTRWRFFVDEAGSSIEILTLAPFTSRLNLGTVNGSGLEIYGNSSDDSGPGFYTIHDSATPAANDVLGYWSALGEDSAGNSQVYNVFRSEILDPTSTSEDGQFKWLVTTAGSFAAELILTGANLNPASDGGLSLGASGTEFLAASIDTVTVTSLELGGAATTDTTIARSAAGEATLEGDAIKHAGKQTIWIPAAAMTTQVTNGCAAALNETSTNDIMFPTKNCDTTTQEGVQWNIGMPKSWNEGTVTYQVFWSHPSTVTNFGVEFDMACGSLANDAAMDTALGTAVEIGVDTGGTTDDVYVTAESGAVTCATAAADTQTFFRLRRVPADAGDTLAVDARIHGVKVFYTDDASTDE